MKQHYILKESLQLYLYDQGHSQFDNWGGLIFIYSYFAQLTSFEIDCYGL